VIDQGVRRVFAVKQAIGLFDNPYRSLDPTVEAALDPQALHGDLARDAARRSIVLLKNEGGLLPLKKSGQKLALIGPYARDRDNTEGCWTLFGDKRLYVNLEDGLRAALDDGDALDVVDGSGMEDAIDGGIDAAVEAARRADVVLLAIGEPQGYSGEAQSRTQIIVPPAQQALADAVAATGTPVVVLLRHGRALALHGAVHDAQAILATWFLGTATGPAVADVLFGDYNPSARLPVSFPRDSGQQPLYYNRQRTGRPELPDMREFKSRWREMPHSALYPFGHGLSYTRFVYGDVELSADTLDWDGTLTVSVTLHNDGSRAGEEVVQLYIHDRVASRVRPIRELKDFRKVALAPGAHTTVEFVLRREQLAFTTRSGAFAAEPGLFDVWIAPDSESGTARQFTLIRA